MNYNIEFYKTNFQTYYNKTCDIDPSPFLSMITAKIQPEATVLDIGCGSGRDLLWLKEKGYQPTGFEYSTGLADLARKHSGCPIIEGDFTKYAFMNLRFDAMLFVGALVHLEYSELSPILQQTGRGLKDNGFIFFSLKEGEGTSTSEDGRTFTLWQHDHLERIFRENGYAVLDFSRVISTLNSSDVWLSYLLHKKGTV